MPEYNVYLAINGIEAKNIEDAKSEFWNIVMEDKAVLSLEVEEVE